MNPEVVAVNKFRHDMAGEPEKIITAEKGNVAVVERGDKGVAIVNFADKAAKSFKASTTLPDGVYTDKVHGTRFTVKNNEIKGSLAPLTSYLIY